MNAGTFAEPGWAGLLWLVVAFAGVAFYLERRRGSGLSALVASSLRERLVRGPSRARRMLALVLFTLSAVSLAIALMRPQWGLRLISAPRAGAEIMICLDVSRSMLAEDVAPNRLERAKAELRDLLPYLDGDQVGLIAFAGRATVLAPLTPDFGFLRLVLDDAGPHSVVRGGTRLEEPIRKAVAGFGSAGEVARSILLITDGEDHDSFPLEAAKEAAARGIKILAIGFGDEAGSEVLVSDPQTGAKRPLRDADGNIVKSRLDGETLREIALVTGGAYVPAGTGLLDLESIYRRHIAPLTRSGGQRHTRSVNGEAFQAFVLLGLLLLVAAVATTGVGVPAAQPRTRRPRAARPGSGAARRVAAVALMLLAASTPARAEETAGNQGQAATETLEEHAATPTPAQTEEPNAEPDETRSETPRETFNRGLRDMQAGQFEAAEDALRDARRRAATDAELRWRATYDLGWNEVKRADAALDSEPEKALEALRRAADWFREAVELRPGADDARHNLEIVLRRAAQLADSLASHDEKKLVDAIEALMDEQRKLTAEVRDAMQQQTERENPASGDVSRGTFRALAAEQLALAAKAGELAARAAGERDTIEQTPEEAREPSARMRAAQLGGALAYLHRARERMGYARSQLRKLQGERAFRRASAALSELGRARDQLLDPVAVLGEILADALDLARLTGRRAALDAGEETPEARWLTDDYLAESQETLRDRTDELYRGFEAGLQNSTNLELSPEQQGLVERIGEASPLLATAIERMNASLAQLKDGNAGAAVDPEFEALRALALARECFLDLRRLVELLYRDQLQAAQILAGGGERDIEELAEYVPVVVDLEQGNVDRTTRVARSIAEEMRRLEHRAAGQHEDSSASATPGADPQQVEQEKARLELAGRLLAPIPDDLRAALEVLAKITSAGAPNAEAFERAREPVQAALEKIEELRRLFFSIIDHLKDLARRQLSLGDATEKVAAIAKAHPEEDHSQEVGPLGARQESWARAAGQLAEALRQQAAQPAPAPAEGSDSEQAAQQAAEMARRLQQAAGHVDSAHAAMRSAQSNLQINPAPLDDVRTDQNLALEELAAAIALFEQPKQQQQQQQQAQEQQQQDQQQQQAGGKDTAEQQQANADPAQLLQGIRDREAQRRQQRAKAEQRGYQAVEKDW